MQQLQYLSGSISHSRLNRRLHALRNWMAHMPELLADMLSTSTIYIIDSMPIPLCRRARAKRCTKVTGVQYDGKCYAKYVSEPLCHQLDARYGGTMIAIHRANTQPNTPAEQRLLRMHRKRIETCNSQLEKMGVAHLHARLTAGVSLKIAASLCALRVLNHS